MNHLLALFSVLLLTACSPNTWIEKFADDAKERIAQDYFQRLKTGDAIGLIAELDPRIPRGTAVAEFQKMQDALPKEVPTATNLVGYHWLRSTDGTTYDLTYQYGFGSKWVLAHVAWRELSDGKRLITSLSVQTLRESLQETNAFSLRRITTTHLFFLSFAILIPIFVVGTLVACIRTKIPKRKWLWVLFILAAFLPCSLNWTTGHIAFSPLSVLFLGASAMAGSIYSPWIISIGLPLGAMWFWLRREPSTPSTPTLPPAPESPAVPSAPGVHLPPSNPLAGTTGGESATPPPSP